MSGLRNKRYSPERYRVETDKDGPWLVEIIRSREIGELFPHDIDPREMQAIQAVLPRFGVVLDEDQAHLKLILADKLYLRVKSCD